MLLSLIVFLPLFSTIFILISGRLIGKYGTILLLIGSLFLSWILSIFYAFKNIHIISIVKLFNWCNFNTFNITFELLFDQLTYSMLLIILTISLIVHIYSTQYLKTDPHLIRFLAWLSLFTFFMLFLVTSENLVQLFIGWEGVGICSYLLINYWYTRIQANKAALKAVFVNKIGDIFLLFAISLCFFLFGSTSFSVMFPILPYVLGYYITFAGIHFNVVTLIVFFFFIGAIGKSAQIGLHIWLPDAMEGPTPVSALLHAATMVTAGVFLIIRLSWFFDHVPAVLTLLLVFGGATAFFAATTGLLQYDLKKIIAFSTCSQLGYMFVACSLSEYTLALFHLFNHAFFKALLFLSAGNVIHALNDEQDIRKMGGLVYFLPLTFCFFFIGSFSLMGIPFLAGFYSKDLIIEMTWITNTPWALVATVLLGLAAFFTALYSFRLIYYVFLAKPNFSRLNLKTLGEANFIVQMPLVFLCLCSIFSGYLFSDLFVGLGSDFFVSSVITKIKMSLIDFEFLNVPRKQFPLVFTFAAILCGLLVLHLKSPLKFSARRRYWRYWKALRFSTRRTLFNEFYYSKGWNLVLQFLNQKWFFDKLYNLFFFNILKSVFFNFYTFLDKGWLEYFGPRGVYFMINKMSSKIVFLQTGNLAHYLGFVFLFWLVFLMFFIFFF